MTFVSLREVIEWETLDSTERFINHGSDSNAEGECFLFHARKLFRIGRNNYDGTMSKTASSPRVTLPFQAPLLVMTPAPISFSVVVDQCEGTQGYAVCSPENPTLCTTHSRVCTKTIFSINRARC